LKRIFHFPPDVATTLNIHRHEEIERFSFGNPWLYADWATGKARTLDSYPKTLKKTTIPRKNFFRENARNSGSRTPDFDF
jgi:hypothetical protein